MKKYIFTFFLSLLLFKTSHAIEDYILKKYEIRNYFFFKNIHILILNDNSIWEIKKLNLRKQTWSEWWHSKKVEIDPVFVWENEDWQKMHAVKIDKNFYLDSLKDKLKKSDYEKLKKFPYIVENYNSKKIGFIKNINIAELLYYLKKAAEIEYQKGFDSGYKKGYKDAYKRLKNK